MQSIEKDNPSIRPPEESHQQKMEKYYKYHAAIYDQSRRFFLLGRNRLINQLPAHLAPKTIFEIGCGTGYNLPKIVRDFPDAQVYGIDTSVNMLKQASKKVAPYANVTLLHDAYSEQLNARPAKADLIIFSYVLSMINPGWKALIDLCYRDLNDGGIVAVIDFQKSKYKWYHRMMKRNHVRLDDHLLPEFKKYFSIKAELSQPAFGGVWRYFTFIGRKVSDQ